MKPIFGIALTITFLFAIITLMTLVSRGPILKERGKQEYLDSLKKENLILEIEEKKIRLKMLNDETK